MTLQTKPTSYEKSWNAGYGFQNSEYTRYYWNKSLTPVHSILSYGDRPNEFDAVVNYFKAHFLQVHKRNNENRRILYTHLTNVTVLILTFSSFPLLMISMCRIQRPRRALLVTASAI